MTSDDLHSKMETLLSVLRAIEDSDIVIPLRPEVDYDDVILIVSDSDNRKLQSLTLLKERFSKYYPTDAATPEAVEAISLFVNALDIAVFLGSELLVNAEQRLVASAVKKVKNAGFVIESLNSVLGEGKSYVAIRTSKGLVVVYLNHEHNHSYTSALAWNDELNQERIKHRTTCTGLIGRIMNLFK